MSINKVILSGTFSFPTGAASASRITNLALGFLDQITDVEIVSAYHHDGNKPFVDKGEHHVKGKILSFQTVAPFQYDSTYKSISKRLKKRFSYLKVVNRLANITISSLSGRSNEMLFLYGRSYLFLNKIINEINRRQYKTKLVFDIVEPPCQKNNWIEFIIHPFILDSVLVFKALLPAFDGCTFISSRLCEEYGGQVQRSIIVPSVLYGGSSAEGKLQSEGRINLGYLGSLIKKDHPELLYNLCLSLHKRTIPFKIQIIGRFRNFNEGRVWEKKFITSPFFEMVEFHHNPSNEKRDEILSKQDYLVLFRYPDRLQSLTFPTRIVELLSLGKVIVVNKIGDISSYFHHCKTAIVVDQKDIDQSISDWAKVHNKTSYGGIISQSKQLLDTSFNANYHCEKILKLFNRPHSEKHA